MPSATVETEGKSYLGWVVVGSFALHVVVVTALPNAHQAPAMPGFASMIVLAEPPASPPPPPRPPEPIGVADRAPSSAPRAVHALRAAVAPAAAAPDLPLDFTSTVFSNDGPGVAVSGGDGRVVAAVAPIAAKAAPPPPMTIVAPASLARKPRAPGLDVELERQYPAEARRSGVSGTAVLRVRILPDGRTGDVHIQSESWRGFGPACERTVRAGRWDPPIDHDGRAVTTEITYTCRFEVRS